jgi:hypothetical protein
LCYRYTIPQLIYEQIQYLTELSGNHLRGDQANRDARRSTRYLPALASGRRCGFEPRPPSEFARTRACLKKSGDANCARDARARAT